MVKVSELKKGNYYIYDNDMIKTIIVYDKNVKNENSTILNFNYKFKIIAVKNELTNNRWDFKIYPHTTHLTKMNILNDIKHIDKDKVQLLKI